MITVICHITRNIMIGHINNAGLSAVIISFQKSQVRIIAYDMYNKTIYNPQYTAFVIYLLTYTNTSELHEYIYTVERLPTATPV